MRIEYGRRSGSETTSRYVDRRVWSPAQFVAGAIGLFLLILGGVTLARTLPGAETLTAETVEVFGFGHTSLMGLIDVGAGLLFLGSASAPASARGGLTVLGLTAVAFGAVVALEPQAFGRTLGIDGPAGWLYLGLGAFAILAAWFGPEVVIDRSRVEDHRTSEYDADADATLREPVERRVTTTRTVSE